MVVVPSQYKVAALTDEIVSSELPERARKERSENVDFMRPRIDGTASMTGCFFIERLRQKFKASGRKQEINSFIVCPRL
jgi:hypothetical protein